MENQTLWDRYFSTLKDVERQSYDGTCNCLSCQKIRNKFYEIQDALENGELSQVVLDDSD